MSSPAGQRSQNSLTSCGQLPHAPVADGATPGVSPSTERWWLDRVFAFWPLPRLDWTALPSTNAMVLQVAPLTNVALMHISCSMAPLSGPTEHCDGRDS